MLNLDVMFNFSMSYADKTHTHTYKSAAKMLFLDSGDFKPC